MKAPYFLFGGLLLLLPIHRLVNANPPYESSVTILFHDAIHPIDNARVEGDDLWLTVDQIAKANGFTVKPQGLCSAETCISISKEDKEFFANFDGMEFFNVSKFARKIGQAAVSDSEKNVWSFGVVPLDQQSTLLAGIAPDFAIPDRTGKIVRLSDFRGKKVMVLAWASWCGCSLDLPNWQTIYQELKDKNFELIAVAEDTEGESAAGKYYDRAKATYTTLIDPKHSVGSLYGMVNVPSGVWIDEEGNIVRPPEMAYAKRLKVLGQEIGDDRYVPALRDWVERGEESAYVMSSEKLKERLAPKDDKRRLADAYFKLGVYFHDLGEMSNAKKNWEESQKLAPENWNYHRQDWSYSSTDKVVKWMKKVRELEGKPYYAPIDFSADAAGLTK